MPRFFALLTGTVGAFAGVAEHEGWDGTKHHHGVLSAEPADPVPLPLGWPFNTHTYDLFNYPDTDVTGTGFMDCNKPEKCMGAQRNYFIQAVVRKFLIKGSQRIQQTQNQNNNQLNGVLQRFWPNVTIAPVDVTFYTRTFEYLPVKGEAKNSPFCAVGGDGVGTPLGPCLSSRPGETLNLFVMNNIRSGPILLNQSADTKEAYQKKMNDLFLNQNNILIRDLFSWGTPAGGLTAGKLFAKNLAVPNEENVPGWTTNHSWDYFNIHLHGMEVEPHLYLDMGTSNPLADWVTIQPYNTHGQQCYCYKFTVSETNSKGVFIYHTHRHGTTSMTTWGGMFGLLMTDALLPSDVELTASGAVKQPLPVTTSNNISTSLMANLIDIAKKENLPFGDADVVPFLIWNSKWKFMSQKLDINDPFQEQWKSVKQASQANVELNSFLPNQIPTTVLDPFLVNDQYQPHFEVTAGHLTLIRLICVSTEWMCGFQIYNPTTLRIQSFDVVSSDGITYHQPTHMKDEGYAVEANVMVILPPSEAFLLLGGGQRQDILVQFRRPEELAVYQTTFGAVAPQTLATITVNPGKGCGTKAGEDDCERKDLTKYKLSAARPFVPADRPIDHVRAMVFAQALDRTTLPYVQWGLSDYHQTKGWFQMYDVHHVNMLLEGGACEIWDICSRNPINHPYHIHVNPVMILNITAAFKDTVLSCMLGGSLLEQKLASPIFKWNQPYEWRDTAWVPPCGCLRVQQCYDAGGPRVPGGPSVGFEGKFVFHCHFLTHEDTGLIHNVMLRRTQEEKILVISQMPKGGAYPGFSILADTTACPGEDPCGAIHKGNAGCAICPHTMQRRGCVCEAGVPNLISRISSSKSTEPELHREFLRAVAKPSLASIAFAACVGGAAAMLALSVGGRLQRRWSVADGNDRRTMEDGPADSLE